MNMEEKLHNHLFSFSTKSIVRITSLFIDVSACISFLLYLFLSFVILCLYYRFCLVQFNCTNQQLNNNFQEELKKDVRKLYRRSMEDEVKMLERCSEDVRKK